MRPFFTEYGLRLHLILSALLGIISWLSTALVVRALSVPGLLTAHPWLVLVAGLPAMVGTLGSGAMAHGALLSVYRRIDRISELAVAISRGSLPAVEGLGEEGSVGRLAHRVSQLAHRMNDSMTAVEEEKARLKEFLSDISHQLKTPLASIRMFHELIADSPTSDDEGARREFVQRGLSQIDRMEWLIRTLLTMARLEAGALTLDPTPQDLRGTVGEAVGALAAEAAAGDVRLHLDPSDPVVVPHDGRWLREAISNLVRNAIQHSPGGGSVTVSIGVTDVFARVAVQDEGGGIAAEDLPHVFTRFYRGRDSGSGTGIGLSLAKSIVEHHGGLISVTSEAGRGSCFTVTLARNLTKL